jgi:hypothetical protein
MRHHNRHGCPRVGGAVLRSISLVAWGLVQGDAFASGAAQGSAAACCILYMSCLVKQALAQQRGARGAGWLDHAGWNERTGTVVNRRVLSIAGATRPGLLYELS